MKVFIVEDYLDIAMPLLLNFRILVQEAEFIPDSRDAVKRIMEFKPDWLVLDICLPYKSGLDVFRELNEKADFRFKVVFYSLYFDEPKIFKELTDLGIPETIGINKANGLSGDVLYKLISALDAGHYYGNG